jgi:DNA helicase HerA-like ATPase
MGMEWQSLKLPKNDRGVLIGATGSGKTFLGRYLVEDAEKPYSVVYDAKISDSIGEWDHKIITDFDELVESEERRIIYRPNYIEAVNPVEQDAFFEWVYLRKNTRLFVDEAYAVTGGTNPSFHFQACLARGRERGISTLVATQRPHRIPLVTLSEAEHYWIFRLTLLNDRKRVEEITGITAEEQLDLKNHEFFYYSAFEGRYPRRLKISV